jgi:hypothetical protein
MKKIYAITIAFAFIILFSFSSKAQNWTVGTPVDMSISYLTKYAYTCAPNDPEFNMNIILNSVSGIQYMAIVDSVQDIAVIFNTTDTLMQGDTILLTSGVNTHSVSFVNNVGKISFNFKAIGTPTQAGENHPCAINNSWVGNLLLCDQSITRNVQNNCTVDAATSINNLTENHAIIQFPNNNNQYQLQIANLKNTDLINLYDIMGKQIQVKTPINSSAISIPCQDLNSGIYFITLTENNTSSTHKFVINK